MVDRDELQHSLSLARAGLRAPSVAKLRVRAKLGADHVPASGAGAGAHPMGAGEGQVLARARRWLTRRPHLTTVAVLMGLSFGAGYWLGRSPETSRTRGEAVLEAPVARAAPAGVDAIAGRYTPETPAAPAKPPSDASIDVVDPAASTTAPSDVPTASGASAGARPAQARRRAARRSAALPATGDDRLAAELALLARTERAIRAGEAPLALVLLGELDQKFPVPALREEREAARVLALCVSAGTVADVDARASAERFIAAHSASVYADRIRESCRLGAVVQSVERAEEGGPAGH